MSYITFLNYVKTRPVLTKVAHRQSDTLRNGKAIAIVEMSDLSKREIQEIIKKDIEKL